MLNILDGLRAQYDGGPGKNAQFVYENKSLYFATDPFALDMTGHRELVAKRKEMKVRGNENPLYTDYLHEGEKLKLGVADLERLDLVEAPVGRGRVSGEGRGDPRASVSAAPCSPWRSSRPSVKNSWECSTKSFPRLCRG